MLGREVLDAARDTKDIIIPKDIADYSMQIIMNDWKWQ
jgi:hypothetical protein